MSDANAWNNPRASASASPMAAFLLRLRVLEGLVRGLLTGTPLQSAAISQGGLTVKDGGTVDVVRDNGDRVRLTQGGIEFLRSGDDELLAIIQLDEGSLWFGANLFTVHASESLLLRSPEVNLSGFIDGGGLAGQMDIDQYGVTITSYGDRDIYIHAQDTGTATMRGQKVEIFSNPGGEGVQVGFASNGPTVVEGSTVTLSTWSGGVRLAAAGTTGSPANCYISGSGQNAQLYQVSSSIRYKQDVEDYHTDQDLLLQATPRSWRDRSEVAADPATRNRYVGFVAEEVDELGLSEFVVYNPDGTPESVAYDRLTVGLLDVVKTQQQQITWLTEKVAQLAGEPMPPFRPDPTPGVRATRPVPPSPIVEEEVP